MAPGGMARVSSFLSRCASQTSNFSRSRRSFSSTPCYAKEALPAFKPSSSPELDQILSKFRQQLFIPMSLSLQHRKLIYKKKYAEKLQENPITVTVGGENGEPYSLRHMSISEHPSIAEFKNAISLMKTRDDWFNLLPFLIGLQTAKRPLTNRRMQWLLRKAGLAGQGQILLQALYQSKRTGLTLSDASVAKSFFLAIRQGAASANFKGEEMKKALRQAQEAAELLNAAENSPADLHNDPKRLPDIIGVLLELSAAEALDSSEGKDVHGYVQGYSEKLVSTWAFKKFSVPEDWTAANFTLLEMVPVWHGMDLALQVDEIKTNKQLSEALKSCMKDLGQNIEAAVDKVIRESNSPDRAGVELAKQLYHK